MRVRIDPPAEAWAARGGALAAEVHAAAGPLSLGVAHIGSTAIPGMAAKPVYDLQMRVAALSPAPCSALDEPLAGLGFARRPYERDHVPAGRPDPPSRWRKRCYTRGAPEPVNLHIRLAGSPNERLALLFRDWLRAHPAAVAAYAAFKLVLADHVADLGPYTDVKDPVVDLVVAAAEDWAAATGWTVTYETPGG
ncbi:GrpB family protein [Dactylosporangium sp. CA-092794]|uniref:GrpB family protein n=1 Tax=Dactylosporangium sp. CA-092794 TaxID=3239929 RepID=UPI003D90293E